jgi:hypothetical protein
MKTRLSILKFGLLVFFFSCGQPSNNKVYSVLENDSVQPKIGKTEKERLAKIRKIEEEDQLDSLRLDIVLKDALKIAKTHVGAEKFQKKYEVTLDSFPVEVEISLDFYFTKTGSHLIIRRNEATSTYIDIYSKNNNTFKSVVSHKQWTMEYVNDTIRDINGDGLKDFVVNWYGTTGCCLKAFSNIYLLRPDKKTFSDNVEFINPTFSPEEKIVRGVNYGHPGQTEMYKYKWNAEKIDTLAYVSYEKNDKGVKTGKIIISTRRPNDKQFKILRTLKSVPIEYLKIDGYDWFTGKGYE